jgi:hypothetical protein
MVHDNSQWVDSYHSLVSGARRDTRENNVEEGDLLHVGCAKMNKVVESEAGAC